ncbi:ATP-binding protein [Actinobacillus arthritidis]|uniref:ATP-binding protein n=1 Tax=Actinobacillus arthritidis TaxID=157339 RepID=UPI00244277F4|nr:ATP-binding protein [Actinobacillus arthritidis]WGE89698.1 ATP-binding protein [Actinobacillus arthritidis]
MTKILKTHSLLYRLIVTLSGISFLIWVISAMIEWRTLHKEINALFDSQQVFFAERLASSNIAEGFHSIQQKADFYQADVDDDALAFAIFTEKGEQIINDGRDGQFFTFQPVDGFQTIHLVEEDDELTGESDVDLWRIYWLKDKDIYVAVGQEVDYRNELINKTILSQSWSWLFGFPMTILAILWIIHREFASLKRLEREIALRKPDELKVISTENLPSEIIPLINNLNHYFERTQTMFNRERRFTSDAAHELRSPLAGLRVQTEIAQMTIDDPIEHQKALSNITNSTDRIAQLIEQLLTLSRLENLERLDKLERIHWRSLIENSVVQLYSQAEENRSEIIVNLQSEPQNQLGKPLLLNLILRNLLDNAISYTQVGSHIYLTLTAENLIVEDDGQGVSDEDLVKLGQPFYRPVDRPVQSDKDEKGSGLGISIIKRIVELHGFSMRLTRSKMGGLKVEILF